MTHANDRFSSKARSTVRYISLYISALEFLNKNIIILKPFIICLSIYSERQARLERSENSWGKWDVFWTKWKKHKMNCEEYKELVDSCGQYECKQYTLYDYVSSWIEYAWVNSYHWYFNTEKYKQWKFAAELLEQYKFNRKLAEYLRPQVVE